MSGALFLVDNIFSSVQYPSHTITAEEEAAGSDVPHLANGRRRGDNRWQPATANSDTWVQAQANRLRMVDTLVLDRGHNLAGKQIKIQTSNDGSTFTDILDTVIPTVTQPGDLNDHYGVRTPEGAWLRRFPSEGATYFRVFIPAMGSGLLPQVVGLWLGLSFRTAYLNNPIERNQSIMISEGTRTQAGWQGSTSTGFPRVGTVRFGVKSHHVYDSARIHFEGNFAVRRPMWIIKDEAASHDAVLVTRSRQPHGFVQDGKWSYPSMEFSWQEHEPRYYP